MVVTDLSIDISVSKLLDWLVDRRHCNIKWQKLASTAHSATKKAISQSENDDELSKILKDYGLDWSSDFDYFAVHILNNFLVEKDGGTGWTGIGATDRSKLWNSVLALYKHENVHLAESASVLTRLIQKEYPSLERNIQKLKSKQEECLTRSVDLEKSSRASLGRYTEDCQKLSINDTESPKPQLIKGLGVLPGIIRDLSNSMTTLLEACQYYTQYSSYSSNVADELKNLEILCRNPECSVYELENGKTPTHIIRDFVDEPTYAVEEIEMEQDYAIEMVDDFEIEVEEGEEPGIIEVDDDDNGVLITQNIVAKGNDAKYVLEYGPTRSLILDDLTELEYFLENIDMESVPNELKSSKIPSWLQIIGNVNAELDSSKVANLLLLSDDPSEADRIAEKINKHKVMARKKERESKSALTERNTLIEEEKKLIELKAFVAKRALILKDFLENSISEKYKNRPVNIQGCRISS